MSDLFNTSEHDIIDVILEDHKRLKEYAEALKNLETALPERQKVFRHFAPLLLAHTRPEELTWYAEIEKYGDQKIEGIEGEVEHALAEQLVAEIRKTNDMNVWSAKVKVLAELVEHHIHEEEDEHLPEFKKNSKKDRRLELGEKYLRLKEDFHQQDSADQDESPEHPSAAHF